MKVSVLMITYNHEKYIRQAIESILDQETKFDFELIISNDNSPDETDSIINEIIKTNPKGNIIKYFRHEKNIGMMPNFLFTINKAVGEYVALCEGDDYWTSNLKLEKQVSFLDKNKDYSICFHNINVLEDNTIQDNSIQDEILETTTIHDLAKYNYIHTPSVVYRNHLFKSFPKYFIKSPIGDYFLHMLNAKYGKIKYLNEHMAVYRIHKTSYWSSKQQIDRENIWITFIKKIKVNFDKPIRKILSEQIYELKTRRLRGFKRSVYKIQYKIINFF
ncbi:glycosyltransferase [Flavobacterium sp. GA093]|uniref:Glycosyltransferase n=1 Tax=Flavobacterium hydrocarbonoxydans TaxID=2683249 RepID=A0A6I4NJW2_9FLAO|nr:glycosyltransferase [Flavobacterium hydrocarbonoxydans]MWB94786.1 glycosyltransferase [Flavobacterium hydrocarbonoxydans]